MLHLALMSHYRDGNSPEFFLAAKALQKEAKQVGHNRLVQVVVIARLSAHFCMRKWDNLGDTLAEAGRLLGVDISTNTLPEEADNVVDILIYHYLQFAILHAGRRGDKMMVRRVIKLMCDYMENPAEKLRHQGGVLKVSIRVFSLLTLSDPPAVSRRRLRDAPDPEHPARHHEPARRTHHPRLVPAPLCVS